MEVLTDKWKFALNLEKLRKTLESTVAELKKIVENDDPRLKRTEHLIFIILGIENIIKEKKRK